MDLFGGGLHKEMEVKQRILFEWLRMFVIAPWWDRMWITQEVGVARKLVLTYGRVTISFDVLKEIINIHPPIYCDLKEENARVLQLLVTKTKCVSQLQELQKYETIADMNELGYFSKSLGSPLLWLLRTFQQNRASEPRDKIYALSGLLRKLNIGDDTKLFAADYDTPAATFFSRAVVHIMQDTGLFWLTSADLAGKSDDKLPSWVPNWGGSFTRDQTTNPSFWAVRLCHSKSDLTFEVCNPATPSSQISLTPLAYYRGLSKDPQGRYRHKVRGSIAEKRNPFGPASRPGYFATVSSTQFFLDCENSQQRRLQYEWHGPEVERFTKTENCLKVPSQLCSTIKHVSKPIAPKLANIIDVIEGLRATYSELFSSAWEENYRRESMGR
ncbi:uncharacterized protein BKA55DRAFT_539609 [Fusarium redolens]|uniref:Heterokaryon incompatibility domain-containing protein n=1 Tax=Fusarium redolens TaxID=48865 RepID=A0A9P9H3K4_FUSRE|nr:uncharacterized protein BKA55DRAFT_539609 [Fusarium redolens]KAH7250041.1 hypothetical protein BKA55DRAFT_539609 [Fusarium redolens]